MTTMASTTMAPLTSHAWHDRFAPDLIGSYHDAADPVTGLTGFIGTGTTTLANRIRNGKQGKRQFRAEKADHWRPS